MNKRLRRLILPIVLILGMSSGAVAVAMQDTGTVEITVTQPGRLAVALNGQDTPFGEILKLVVHGDVNETDIKFIKENLTSCGVLDLSEAPIGNLASYALSELPNLREVILPEGLALIYYGSFQNDSNLERVVLPKSLQYLDSYVFSSCHNLTDINLGELDDLYHIGYGVFSYSGITSVDLPRNVQNIGSDAFNYCSNLNLRSITLPASVSQLDNNAFQSQNLEVLSAFSVMPPASSSSSPFYQVVQSNCYISIPASSYEDYLSAPFFSGFVAQRRNIAIESCTDAVIEFSKAGSDARALTAGGHAIYLPTGNQVTFYLSAPEGQDISVVMWNGENVTSQLIDGAFTTPAVDANSTLTVICSGHYNQSGISVTPEELTVNVGESATLSAISYVGGLPGGNVTWSSADKAIATVDESGKVTGVKAGEVAITATLSDGISADCIVTVFQPATGITIADQWITMQEYETLQLEAIIEPEDASDKTVTWHVDNNEYFTVDENGLVTALRPTNGNNYTVYATTHNGLQAHCYILINELTGFTAGGDTYQIYDRQGGKVLLYNIDWAAAGITDGKVVVPETVDYKGTAYQVVGFASGAFDGDENIRSVVIDDRIQYIGMDAFANCPNLTDITITAKTPPRTNTYFYGYALNISRELYSVYKADEQWKNCTYNIIDGGDVTVTLTEAGTLPVALKEQSGFGDDEITRIAVIGPMNATDFKFIRDKLISCGEVDLSSAQFTSLPENAFNSMSMEGNVNGMRSLKKVILPGSCTEIGSNSFYYCQTLEEVVLSEALTSIGYSAFYYTSKLKNLDFSRLVNLTSIGDHAFQSSGITSFVAPASINSIGGSAFSDCPNLRIRTLNFPATLGTLGGNVFNAENMEILTCKTSYVPNNYYSVSPFSNLNAENCLVAIPLQAYDSYYNDTHWNALFTRRNKVEVSNCPDAVITFSKPGNDAPAGELSSGMGVYVPASGMVTFNISAVEGKTIRSVMWNGEDVTSQLDGGSFTTPEITADASLTVICDEHFGMNGVTLSSTELTVNVSEYAELTAVAYIDGLIDNNISWSSSDENVATVGAGAVYGVAPGTAIITATARNGATATCTVTVVQPVSELSMSSETYIQEGQRYQIYVSVYPENATDKTITWSVANPEIATIDEEGYVTGMSVGETTVTATASNGVSASTLVTVSELQAFDAEDGFRYEIISKDDMTVRLMPRNYYEWNSVASYENLGENLVIPSKVTFFGKEYTVTEIGNNAFYYCNGVKSVFIPKTIKKIGEYAFMMGSESSIEKVEIEDLTAWFGIEFGNSYSNPMAAGMEGAEAVVAGIPVTALNVPHGIKNIPAYVFAGCSSLTSISMIPGVESIGEGAFMNCRSLQSVTFPDGVKEIGTSAFSSCVELTAVELPDGMTSIGESAFIGCAKLASVKFPASLVSIGNSAFAGCEHLVSLSLPETLASIGMSAFQGCKDVRRLNIPANVSEIGASAFQGCSSLESVSLPKSLTVLQAHTFAECTGLRAVLLPEGLVAIGDNCFSNTSIQEIDLPETLQTIGNYAFQGNWSNNGLREIVIPDAVTSIGAYAFYTQQALHKVVIGKGITEISTSAFEYCSRLTSIDLPDAVTTIGDRAFAESGLARISIGKGIASIGSQALKTSDLTLIRISAGTPPEISEAHFGYSTEEAEKRLVLVNNAEVAEAYKKNSRWSSFNIFGENENAVTVYTSGEYPLAEEIRTQTGIMPALVTNLTIVGPLSETDFIIMRDNMTSCYSFDLSRVTNEEIPAQAFNRKPILMDMILPSGLKRIGDNAFSESPLLNLKSLPKGLVSIGSYAFMGCRSLDLAMVFPETLESIGYGAFQSCTALPSVDMSMTKVAYMSGSTFQAATDLREVILPPTLTNISSYDFANTAIQAIEIPAGVTGIGNQAFQGTPLRAIDVPASVTSIDYGAFENCTRLGVANLSLGLTSLGERAFAGCKKLTAISSPNKEAPSAGRDCFQEVKNKSCVLSVPTSSYRSYLNAPQWGMFANLENRIEIEIGDGADVSCISEQEYQDNQEDIEETPAARSRRRAPAASAPVYSKLYDGASICVDKDNSDVRFFINVAPDAELVSVMYNGVDVTDRLEDNMFVASAKDADGFLQVITKTEEPPVVTEKVNVTVNVMGTDYGKVLVNGKEEKAVEVDKASDVVLEFILTGDNSKLTSVIVDCIDRVADVVDRCLSIENITEDVKVDVIFTDDGQGGDDPIVKEYVNVTVDVMGIALGKVLVNGHEVSAIEVEKTSDVVLEFVTTDDNSRLSAVSVNGIDRMADVVDGLLVLTAVNENIDVKVAFELCPSSLDNIGYNKANITVEGNRIIVNGLNGDNVVRVFDVSGRLVYLGDGSDITITVSGVYMVAVGDNLTKVFVR